MFLNKTMLKKLIKSSFKWEGLVIGRVFDGIVAAGNQWVTWTQDGYVPNWLKAALIEYAGELPEKGRMFRATQNEPLQYEIADADHYNLPEIKRLCQYSYVVTPVIFRRPSSKNITVLQQIQTGKFLFALSDYLDIIDLSELGEENAPSGPASINERDEFLLYKNEHSAYAFAAYAAAPDDTCRQIAACLQGINFSEEG